ARELQEAQISETGEREPVLAVLLPEPSAQARLVPRERRDEGTVLRPRGVLAVLFDADQHHQQHRRPDDPHQRADTPRRGTPLPSGHALRSTLDVRGFVPTITWPAPASAVTGPAHVGAGVAGALSRHRRYAGGRRNREASRGHRRSRDAGPEHRR